MLSFSLSLFLWPDFFIAVFDPGNSDADFGAVSELTRHLLYFVAGYSVVDAANVVYSSALKGAGDTRFVLGITMVVSLTVMVAPVYVACTVFEAGVYVAWLFLSLWVVALAGAFYLRYRAGHWRSMRVIEHAPAPAAAISEGPVVDAP
jgi:MATE family multidrug resistance protein